MVNNEKSLRHNVIAPKRGKIIIIHKKKKKNAIILP